MKLHDHQCCIVVRTRRGKYRQCKRLPLFDGMCEQHAKMKGKI